MKKTLLVIFLSIVAGNIVQAQFLKTIKAKAKAAVDNSVDRSSNKVIDKAINNPADNVTDTVLDKTGKKIHSIFKKKKKGDAEQTAVSESDPTAIKPTGIDSNAVIIPARDSTVIPKNQN